MTDKVQPIFNIKHVVPYNKNLQDYMRTSSSSSTASTAYTLKSGKRSKSLKGLDTVQTWLIRNLRNFCNTTSLHGFNYISRSDFSPKERLFWLIVVIISIIVSIALVVVSYVWNRETPTVTVIESSHYPTWNIPFPAVTMCNFNKISKTKSNQLASEL